MLNKTTAPVSAYNLVKKVNSEGIRFDLAIQRRGVWTLEQKQNLIDSLLNNFPVPPIYFVDKGDKVQWALDGQQRTRAVAEYFNGQYELSQNISAWMDEDGTTHEIAGLKYDELHEDVRIKLNSTNISTVIFQDITEDEITEMFKRLNAGTPFKKIELTRIDMPSSITEFINEISKDEFFAEKVNISEKSRIHFADHELILQTLMLYTEQDRDFSGKDIRNFVMEYILTENEKTHFKNTLEYVNKAFPEASKTLKKTSVPVVMKVAEKAMYSDLEAEEFGKRIVEFLSKQKVGGAYNSTCTSGSAKKESVSKRLKILDKAVIL